MNADGSDAHPLVVGSASCPTWSPNGHRIAYDTQDGIWVTGAAGAFPPKRILKIRGARYPRWSPDGHRIAFTLDRRGAFPDIAFVDSAGGEPHEKVTDTPRGVEDNPGWHPSGDRLLFILYTGSGPDLYRVTRRPFERVQPAFPDFESRPEWSPDGRWVIYPKDTSIFRARSDGTEKQRLADIPKRTSSLDWMPR
jgi:Tol biopolymer transport system component